MSRPTRNAIAVRGRVRVTLRGDGRFRVIWTDDVGRQREKTLRDQAAAISHAEKISAGFEDGTADGFGDAPFALLIQDFLNPDAQPTWGRKHRDQQLGFARNHLIPVLGSIKCSSLRPAHGGQLLRALTSRGLAVETKSQILQMLRAIGAWGEPQTWLPGHHPFRGTRLPRQMIALHARKKVDVPSSEQSEDLANAMTRPEYGLMVRVAHTSGLRWGELIALQPSDVNLELREVTVDRQYVEHDSGEIELGPPKGAASYRTVVIPTDVAKELATHISNLTTQDALLFTSPSGCVLRRSNFNRRFLAPARAASSYPDRMTWHGLRRCAITNWVQRLPIADVPALAGHKDLTVTMRKYVGADDSHLDRTRDRIR